MLAVQLPSWSATTVANSDALLPRYSLTVLPASAVPLKVGSVMRVMRSVLLLPGAAAEDDEADDRGDGGDA